MSCKKFLPNFCFVFSIFPWIWLQPFSLRKQYLLSVCNIVGINTKFTINVRLVGDHKLLTWTPCMYRFQMLTHSQLLSSWTVGIKPEMMFLPQGRNITTKPYFFLLQAFYLQITIWQIKTCRLLNKMTASNINIQIQIRTFQLLFFTEKFSPLLGFEPGSSPVPRRNATNRIGGAEK